MLRERSWLIAGVLGLLALSPAQAEDKVLLIGSGQFEDQSIASLPGIDIDVANMRQVVKAFGFADHQIRELSDRAGASPPTLANVEQAFTGWLREGLSPEDRVFIYITSHGAQIKDDDGDETDGADEILILRDTRPVKTSSGAWTLSRVLTDDRFGELLAALPSQNIFVMIDACHSGTATRSFTIPEDSMFKTLDGIAKRWIHPAMPKPSSTDRSFFIEEKTPTLNYVALAAAGDDESALATRNGSVFTQGVMRGVQVARNSGQALTPAVLHEVVAKFIKSSVPPARVFVPQLSGDENLKNKDLFATASRPDSSVTNFQPGPLWQSMLSLTQNAAAFPVELNQLRFVNRDMLEMSFEIPHEGYLNVININTEDQTTILFPNRLHADNKVSPGVIKIPTSQMGFRLRAGAPFGPSLIVAFLTSTPLDTFKSGDALNAKDVFRTLSAQGMKDTKSFTVEAVEPFMAGSAVALVCANAEQCLP